MGAACNIELRKLVTFTVNDSQSQMLMFDMIMNHTFWNYIFEEKKFHFMSDFRIKRSIEIQAPFHS